MSNRVQEFFSNCCSGMQTFATNAGTWISQTAKTVGSELARIAAKVYEYMKPVFEAIGNFFAEATQFVKDFVAAHPNETMIGAVAAVVGAVIMFIITQCCCSCKSNTPAIAPAGKNGSGASAIPTPADAQKAANGAAAASGGRGAVLSAH